MSAIVRHAVLTDHGPWPAVQIVSGPHGSVADLCIKGGDGVTIFARTDLDGLLRVRDAINAVEAEFREDER